MSIEYEKFHGTGNDFVVVDADEYVPDRAAFARKVCDRREGVSVAGGSTDSSVGADGTLFLALEPQFSPPRVVMTLVQPDGSTAAMCGNGARCAAKWAAERTGADAIMLDTQAGTRRADVRGDEVTIEMGEPSFAPADVPLAADREDPLVAEEVAGVELTAVNTGVPHAVAFVDDVDEVDLETVGPAVRNADAFPEGANATFASPRPDGGFDQRTYERGVEGETRSCGTGAVAIGVAARRLGRTDEAPVSVFPPGGELEVGFRNGRATLTGPAEREFEGEIASTPNPRTVSEA
ncbi:MULTISPECIES: diaminopimelate epimerase [Halorussus]|uniref:diaminopimelate epimerase n=1 Tax=Halorussus TaxID=1070314 RepID=UPI000E2138AA|nr:MULTISPECIES: diaminopimelate epimerase [Halorussus]NHN58004.1 diaminopimelate epimerase [Halorussus sp. JP-T4]